MRIGFVSTWLERGATYVTKSYIQMLKDKNELFVFARGGEFLDKNLTCEGAKITYGYRLQGTKINWRQFNRWIKANKLEVIIFNEQNLMDCVYRVRKFFPNILLGAYVDYYTEKSIDEFKYYHFLLCNTKRHFDTFKWHSGAYYLPWGCDLNLFIPSNKRVDKNQIVFFHSMGMSPRKGTKTLINAFIDGKFFEKKAKLIIHTQKDISDILSINDATKYNIQIINKTVSHPGLYYMGDIYVYPTTLDGLGLTIYESLASGLPVITTNEAPMNEIIDDKKGNGKTIDVESYHCRKDAYYWPLSFVNEQSLIESMNYYCINSKKIEKFKTNARKYAEENLDILDVKENLDKIFNEIITKKDEFLNNNYNITKPINYDVVNAKRVLINNYIPDWISNIIRNIKERNFKKI